MLHQYDVPQYKPRYGQAPHDLVLDKMEVTRLTTDDDGDAYDDYDAFARETMVDWGPDTPFLESDQKAERSSRSVSTLNLRHGGTRGTNPDLPRHPEIFYGFMDMDPRGRSDDPRMYDIATQARARKREMTARMTDSSDQSIPQTPWTDKEVDMAHKETHKWVKARQRIFTEHKEGRHWGNKTIVPPAGMNASEKFSEGMQKQSMGDYLAVDGNTSSAVRQYRGTSADLGAIDVKFIDSAHDFSKSSRKSGGTNWRDADQDVDVREHSVNRTDRATNVNRDGFVDRSGEDQQYEESTWLANSANPINGGTRGTNVGYISAENAARGLANSRADISSNVSDREHGYSMISRGITGNYINGDQDKLNRIKNAFARSSENFTGFFGSDMRAEGGITTTMRSHSVQFYDNAEAMSHAKHDQDYGMQLTITPVSQMHPAEKAQMLINLLSMSHAQSSDALRDAASTNRTLRHTYDAKRASEKIQTEPVYFREDSANMRNPGVYRTDGKAPTPINDTTGMREEGITKQVGRARKHSMYADKDMWTNEDVRDMYPDIGGEVRREECTGTIPAELSIGALVALESLSGNAAEVRSIGFREGIDPFLTADDGHSGCILSIDDL